MEKRERYKKALPWIVLAAVLCFATIGLDDTSRVCHFLNPIK